MTSKHSTGSAHAGTDTVSAAILGSGSDAGYAMFAADRLSPDGAFLRGSVFLEVQEEFTVVLSKGDASVRVRARVESLQRGDTPGMRVTFVGVGSAERDTITNRLAGG